MNDEIPVAPQTPRFVTGPDIPARSRVINLVYPVEMGGKTYTTITVRRLTAGEVEAFVAAVQRGENPALPMTDAPPGLLDGLDASDFHAVNLAISDFLPPALRAED